MLLLALQGPASLSMVALRAAGFAEEWKLTAGDEGLLDELTSFESVGKVLSILWYRSRGNHKIRVGCLRVERSWNNRSEEIPCGAKNQLARTAKKSEGQTVFVHAQISLDRGSKTATILICARTKKLFVIWSHPILHLVRNTVHCICTISGIAVFVFGTQTALQ